jgi:hypothetical protein
VSADTDGAQKRRQEREKRSKRRIRRGQGRARWRMNGMRERGEKSGPNYYKLRGLWQAISLGLQFHVDTRNRQEDGALAEDNDGRTVN